MMIVFSVALPADVPASVIDLVRGVFAFLRGLLGVQGVKAVISEINEEGNDG